MFGLWGWLKRKYAIWQAKRALRQCGVDTNFPCPACRKGLPCVGEFPNQKFVVYPLELTYNCPHCGAALHEYKGVISCEAD